MRKQFSQVLWCIAGVLLTAGGIFCLMWPDLALGGMEILFGVAMVISGVMDIAVFTRGRQEVYGAGWFLAEGILTIVLALPILFSRAFSALTLPYIFGMWLLFTGITRMVHSFELQREQVKGWGWYTGMGACAALVGFLSFMDPLVSILTMSVLLGTLLLVQGISAFLRAFFSDKFWK